MKGEPPSAQPDKTSGVHFAIPAGVRPSPLHLIRIAMFASLDQSGIR